MRPVRPIRTSRRPVPPRAPATSVGPPSVARRAEPAWAALRRRRQPSIRLRRCRAQLDVGRVPLRVQGSRRRGCPWIALAVARQACGHEHGEAVRHVQRVAQRIEVETTASTPRALPSSRLRFTMLAPEDRLGAQPARAQAATGARRKCSRSTVLQSHGRLGLRAQSGVARSRRRGRRARSHDSGGSIRGPASRPGQPRPCRGARGEPAGVLRSGAACLDQPRSRDPTRRQPGESIGAGAGAPAGAEAVEEPPGVESPIRGRVSKSDGKRPWSAPAGGPRSRRQMAKGRRPWELSERPRDRRGGAVARSAEPQNCPAAGIAVGRRPRLPAAAQFGARPNRACDLEVHLVARAIWCHLVPGGSSPWMTSRCHWHPRVRLSSAAET